ncbi:DUF1484 family protein [Cupriavidus basilensis]|uniref:DUF1484 family protein n=1 Tax=Cupriavidus basilensis TaxID=68895 RepID=A0A0C4Y3J3_9BURK|nr:DUF1484 family protein [Cupriavidus basilensis]AJG17430.1 hypothetical protein RR42_m0015 [Cupriavidus basilensis]
MTARQRRPRTAAEAREAALEARPIAAPLLPSNDPGPSHEATHQGCHELLRIRAHLESVISLLNLHAGDSRLHVLLMPLRQQLDQALGRCGRCTRACGARSRSAPALQVANDAGRIE